MSEEKTGINYNCSKIAKKQALGGCPVMTGTASKDK